MGSSTEMPVLSTQVELIEPLEPRQLLSASISDGILQIKGTSAADSIRISRSRGTLTVLVGAEPARTFAASSIDSIRIRAQGGNDNVSPAQNLRLPLVIYGGAGNDTLIGTPGIDKLNGGAGNDSLSGEAGNDILRGASGNDTLAGGPHNDILEGDDGNDQLRGNNGRDTLRGGAGNDTLLGLDDNDQLFGSAGADSLDGGDNDDILNGGADNDTLFDHSGSDILRGETGDDSLDSTDGLRGDGLNGGDGTNTVTKDADDFESPSV